MSAGIEEGRPPGEMIVPGEGENALAEFVRCSGVPFAAPMEWRRVDVVWRFLVSERRGRRDAKGKWGKVEISLLVPAAPLGRIPPFKVIRASAEVWRCC